MRTPRHAAGILVALFAVAGCATARREPSSDAPPMLLGDFVDDYGNRFAISAAEWRQLPRGRLHVRRWNAAAHYLIAQNDSASRYAPGRWTRIDWVALPGMPPYAWAFCLSAYEAPSFAAAESTTVARPETPRTGCNGYPFSRMRRATPADSVTRRS